MSSNKYKTYKRCPKCQSTRWTVDENSLCAISYVFDTKDGSYKELSVEDCLETDRVNTIECTSCGYNLQDNQELFEGPSLNDGPNS